MRKIQGKLVLLRVCGEFELPRVRVIGVQLYCAVELRVIVNDLHMRTTGWAK